ncbi:39S ribosomal protein L46, mitochondrial-like [Mizuhopecten yessoensis]|uniref:Large ribosomal subunit protein mL46 n=1 Tax=Mizuhopecten yessoensis TaxID=6573 RepID=A0A210Q0T0_MIZYE|nr:39S ribosomal protein L46, mitochondrial-like [Mizuhopecten yessoensis]OWF42332.1 39S ribosomal protein L46, mitochondrial [Mizuhopecten yessoensis]
MATIVRSSLNIFPRFAQRLTAFRAYQRTSLATAVATESRPIDEKWTLASAVCLERYPKIVQQKTPLEDRISINLQKIELEQSVLCDHELKHLEDMAKKKQIEAESGSSEPLKGGEVSAGLPEETKLTAADLEDSWEKDALEFVLEGGSRETAADKENDLQSLNRKLDKKLFLVVKQRIGDYEHWMLPQGDHQQDESMRETAERTLRETCGDSIQSRFLGNAPCGFYREKLSKTLQEKLCVNGNKVFFFRAEFNQGSVIVSDRITDYKWLTVEEMADYLEPDYYKKCKMFVSDLW